MANGRTYSPGRGALLKMNQFRKWNSYLIVIVESLLSEAGNAG